MFERCINATIAPTCVPGRPLYGLPRHAPILKAPVSDTFAALLPPTPVGTHCVISRAGALDPPTISMIFCCELHPFRTSAADVFEWFRPAGLAVQTVNISHLLFTVGYFGTCDSTCHSTRNISIQSLILYWSVPSLCRLVMIIGNLLMLYCGRYDRSR